jgi:hypothetical protein
VFFIFPSPGFLAINMNKLSESSSKFDFNIEYSNLGGYLNLVASTILYFCLAVYLDSRLYKLGAQKADHMKPVQSFENSIIDKDKIYEEGVFALKPDKSFEM